MRLNVGNDGLTIRMRLAVKGMVATGKLTIIFVALDWGTRATVRRHSRDKQITLQLCFSQASQQMQN